MWVTWWMRGFSRHQIDRVDKSLHDRAASATHARAPHAVAPEHRRRTSRAPPAAQITPGCARKDTAL